MKQPDSKNDRLRQKILKEWEDFTYEFGVLCSYFHESYSQA